MPEHRIDVRLTRADQSASPYYHVPVALPAGTTRIDVTMGYPKAADSVIDLGILDSRASAFPSTNGFRGWSGGARDHFFIATDDATPGYIPGPMPPGEWKVLLGLYKIPSAGVDVSLAVSFDASERATIDLPETPAPVRPGAGWYQGDLHCHTYHSDARGSPERLHAAARAAGLDFLAVTDHNTISQRRYFHRHSSPDLVFVRGMEVTTAAGHANVFGLDEWIDFRMSRPADAYTLADLVHRRGGLLSINHDKPPIPWQYDLPAIDGMEVWHQHWFARNWMSLERYDARLREGRRISLVGGSDFHQPEQVVSAGPFTLARPTTVLWLKELSEKAVLAAIKSGHGYVSEAPDGPHLSFTANGKPMGARVDEGGPMDVAVEVKGAAGDRLVWVDAGGIVGESVIPDDAWKMSFSFGLVRTFLRAEIVAVASRDRLVEAFRAAVVRSRPSWAPRDEEVGRQPLRRALSNPVYVKDAQ